LKYNCSEKPGYFKNTMGKSTYNMHLITDRTKLWTALCIMIFFLMQISLYSCSSGTGHNHLRVQDGKVFIDIQSLQDGSPEFFSVKVRSGRVNFFVLSLNGEVESYLDACENCYQFKKGYKAEGPHIVCKYCGTSYPMSSLKEGLAGCHPMPLKGKTEGSSYVITVTEMEKAVRYF
jgi:uncharacterized membrane protein